MTFMPSASRHFDALPSADRAIVEAWLHPYAICGPGDVKRLRGRDGHRLRIGSFRVMFEEDAEGILAVYIGRPTTTTYGRG